MDPTRISRALPWIVGLACIGLFAAWMNLPPRRPEVPREPLAQGKRDAAAALAKRQGGSAAATAAAAGKLIPGPGRASTLPGEWTQFRGAARDNIARPTAPLAASWPPEGPRVLWRIATGEGHAGAAVSAGRVYLLDYLRAEQPGEPGADAIRCLSLDDGAELWRYTYPVEIKRNHGMSRTVPAVGGGYVVTLGPKCHVTCLDAATGRLVWQMDLVAEFGTTVPPWYAGQCPLIDGERVILAPGGSPLMMAVELATGRIAWRTTRASATRASATYENLGMTHSSIVPIEWAGRRLYVYCAQRGVVGVDAADGRVRLFYPDWTIKIANVPSPLPVPPDGIFLSGGYGSGSELARIADAGASLTLRRAFRLKPDVFGADQATPVLWREHIYGIIPGGQVACLTLEGTQVWKSGPRAAFGLGPFLLIDSSVPGGDPGAAARMLALNDMSGELVQAEVSPAGWRELSRAKVLSGHDAWGPLALAGTRLLLRDLTELVCLELGAPD